MYAYTYCLARYTFKYIFLRRYIFLFDNKTINTHNKEIVSTVCSTVKVLVCLGLFSDSKNMPMVTNMSC